MTQGTRAPHEFSRRAFLCSAASTAALSLPMTPQAQAADKGQAAGDAGQPRRTRALTLRINGQEYALSLDPRTTLLDAIRDHAGLSGTKKGCGHGQCGACTVHVDGRRVLACMTFALMNSGREIT